MVIPPTKEDQQKMEVFDAKVGQHEIDNGWIVPYCPLLSKTFNAHINVEYCNSVKAIKYANM